MENRIDTLLLVEEDASFFEVSIEIENISNSPISFWMMSCSWQDNWTFSTELLGFYPQECPGNFPKLAEMLPHDKLVLKSLLFIKASGDLNKNLSYRLGFIFIGKDEVTIDEDFFKVLNEKKQNQNSIIWSEKLRLNI